MLRNRKLPWGAVSLALAIVSVAPAHAADESLELVEARKLFAAALKDQEAGRYAEALRKLTRVQGVRDTSPVRYQLARTYEGLGRVAKARELYLRATDGTQASSSEDATVEAAARESAVRLATKVGHVGVDGPAIYGDERLTAVDDDPWAGGGLREVDPGAHVLRVESDGGKTRTVPFTVAANSTVAVRLFVVHTKAGNAPVASAVPTARERTQPSPWAWVSLGVGAAALGTGVALLLVREGQIGNIEDTCPLDRCPSSSREQVESWQSRANTMGVIGVGAAAVGAVGLAVGGGLLLFGPRTTKRQAGLAPLPGGAQIWAGGSF